MKNFLIILIAILCCAFVIVSCGDSPNEYRVDFCFPKGEFNDTFTNFVAAYVIADVAGDEPAKFSKSLVALGDSVVKKIYGGAPIPGKLEITENYLEFKPGMGSSFFIKDVKEIKIPTEDIRSARIDSSSGYNEFVIVSTVKGEFRYLVSPINIKSLGYSDGNTVCRRIYEVMKH